LNFFPTLDVKNSVTSNGTKTLYLPEYALRRFKPTFLERKILCLFANPS